MLSRGNLFRLYSRGLSMHEISRRLNIPESRVVYWMCKWKIKRRSISDAIYIKRNPKGDPFQPKYKLNRHELVLLGIGLGLWWGEGSKKHRNTVRLGNTDPNLVLKFIEFLKKICGIDTRRLTFGLQVFNDMDAEKALNFWIKILNVPKNKFQKVVVTPSRGVGTYRQKTRYGVLTIYFHNSKLRKFIDNLMQQHAVVAQLVEQLHGKTR